MTQVSILIEFDLANGRYIMTRASGEKESLEAPLGPEDIRKLNVQLYQLKSWTMAEAKAKAKAAPEAPPSRREIREELEAMILRSGKTPRTLNAKGQEKIDLRALGLIK